jgi:hypothetical protein
MLKERIEAMVKRIGELIDEYWQKQGFSQEKPTHRADYISDKWCRIVVIERGEVRSVYGFVCLQDYETKTLGKLKAGDIHKSAGFKAPAKQHEVPSSPKTSTTASQHTESPTSSNKGNNNVSHFPVH